jgi:hypothetical protein
MVELCEGLCLALKTCEPLGIVRYFRREQLERDIAAELSVGGSIHLSHTARTQR